MLKYPFSKIVYRKPRFYRTDTCIESIIGLDTEADTEARTFMICLSDGSVFTPEQFPECMFGRKYRNGNFGVWNISYDSGALIGKLTPDERTELRENGTVKSREYKYTYIRKRMFKISKGKNAFTVWDIFNFYKMGLDSAARKYLNEHKDDINPNLFTSRYVKKNWDKIAKYCIQDAVLVSKLYDYFLHGLLNINVRPNALYSCASISYRYFMLNSKIVTSWRYWTYYRELVHFACNAYSGGKFEVYRRGRFNGISYDIVSAYPYEMQNLIDITGAEVIKSRHYVNESTYGFLQVYIDNSKAYHLPCTYKIRNLCTYPAGQFNAYVTKQEYDYIKSLGVKIKIIIGYWINISRNRYPYRETVNKLFEDKNRFKGIDERMYMITKLLLNSFYGKMIQLIEKPDGKIHAGHGFNPMYAAIVTANTRIKLTHITNEYPKNVLAVHTDSVIMNKPLAGGYQGHKLGNWEKETEGDGVIIACGLYQHGDKVKVRGVEKAAGFDLIDSLVQAGTARTISIPRTVVYSWIQANCWNKDDLTNKFVRDLKTLDLNAEHKRVWNGKTTARKLLETSQNSYPHILLESPYKYKEPC